MRYSAVATVAAVASAAFFGMGLAAAMPSPAHAAEIKLLGPVSLRIVLPGLLPQFEQSSGHKVTVGYDTLGAITKRLVEGEAADVAMVSPAQNDELQKQGKLLGDSRAEIARVGFTVFVKKGAPKPDIGSVEAFRPVKKCGDGYYFKVGDRATWSYLLPERLGTGRYQLDVAVSDRKHQRRVESVVFTVG